MDEIEVRRGEAPLVVSFPHTGTEIPDEIATRLISRERGLQDTDWWIDRLYAFVRELDATTVRTPFSRTVIDVNRDPGGQSLYPGQVTTGLVPVETFDGEPLYEAAAMPTEAEITARRSRYFEPFHTALAAEVQRLKAKHDHVVLYDCHSIRSVVPRLFPGTLPVFNIGTNGGASCAPALQRDVTLACAATGRSLVVNGRFRGGWITRHYGRPAGGVHAVQMELAQSFYMDEDRPELGHREEAAADLRAILDAVVKAQIA